MREWSPITAAVTISTPDASTSSRAFTSSTSSTSAAPATSSPHPTPPSPAGCLRLQLVSRKWIALRPLHHQKNLAELALDLRVRRKRLHLAELALDLRGRQATQRRRSRS
ncbi:LRR receptor-like serine/threonine-protein kinase RKF3 [Pyrus ussuriensis x Pyrus communis]|uniref:LRR receptor-like serine/threonine-protein kinase RKF3 n=1 Tax=Pyrus ussuriensis x Pyrus communis TaxID=2448454 RepID=A0A5N5FY72_9ROSA|nr:LRR receptor-like serine/threonine-protein kinase RKF3 [Pyrus ussuriensis x Pyrus communis]